MFKERKAIISKVEIKLQQGLIRLKYLMDDYSPIPINIEKSNYSEYVRPIVVSMQISTLRNKKYSPMEWNLVSEAYSMQDYEHLCNLEELLKGDEGVHIEALKEEKVTIIVDDDKYNREKIIFAIGTNGKCIIPF